MQRFEETNHAFANLTYRHKIIRDPREDLGRYTSRKAQVYAEALERYLVGSSEPADSILLPEVRQVVSELGRLYSVASW